MLADGAISSAGPPALLPELLLDDPASEAAIGNDAPRPNELIEEQIIVDTDSFEASSDTASASPKKGKLVLEEERAVGRVPKTLVVEYVKNFGGPFVIMSLLASSILLEFTALGNTFFVGLWSGKSFSSRRRIPQT